MALMRSGQKGLDEIQRIRAAMEGGNPVITEVQQGLIKRNAALLGEDGDAIIQDIQSEAEKDGRLPADIFKLIESCCQDLNKRVASLEILNELVRERKPGWETGAGGGHEGAGVQVQRRSGQRG
jgi:N6-adenosine-specific RNA methylase IME4